jgi:hypothetical protein
MIFSQQQLFSDNQAVTGDAVSTNILDTLAALTPIHGFQAVDKDYGKGTPVPISVRVTEAFNLLTSLAISVEVSGTIGFTSSSLVITEVIPLAALAIGKDAAFRYLPKGTDERYIRLDYAVTGTDPTLGVIHAGIVAGHDDGFGV